MKNTGELLKQKRESANLSLSEVALATKINPKVLAAIEKGEVEKLPAKTFLKGFVRAYAVFLKADVDEVMRSFTEETGGPAPAAIHEAYQKSSDGSTPATRRGPTEESSSGMRTALVLIIAVLIGAIIGVRELIEKYQKEKVVATSEVKVSPLPGGEATAPPVVAAVEAKAKAPVESKLADELPIVNSIEPASIAMSRAPVSVIPKPNDLSSLAAIEMPRAPASVNAKPASDKPAVIEKPTPADKPAVVEKPVAAKPSEDPKDAPPTKVAGKKAVRNEIILEAVNSLNVDFKVHGEARHLSLSPTEVHTIRSDGPVTLELSDGGAVNIILNGVERGVPGDPGKPKQVKIP